MSPLYLHNIYNMHKTISPANLLSRWFGQDDFMAIASKYDILQNDPPYKYRDKIRKHFAELAGTLYNS